MGLRRKTILLLIFSSFMSVGWGQDCPENMFWSDCGSMCEPTCSNPEFDPDITCPDVCVEGCFCNSGFIFLYDNYWDQNYNICIPIEDCQEEPPCDEETEVELWGECYNIEETTSLNLSNQELNEPIPPEIGNLENLTMLDLSNVGLNGQIPPEIGNLENLTIVDLGHNQLTGQIPIQIGNLTNLEYLGFNHNELIGEIPSELGNLTNLTHIRLNYNQLTGEIPSEIGNLVNLEILKLYNNEFTFVSDSICNLTNLFWSSGNYGNYDSNIYNNNLCPPCPSCIEDYVGYQDTSNCEEPSLCDEGYTEIDGECYYQSDLDVLQDFIDNSQGGNNPPPSDLSPIELCGQLWIDGRLVNLYCSGDDLEQDESYIDFELDIPESIGNLTSLMSFGLEYNNLSSIPESIGNLTNLLGLLLHHNQLTSLPESIGNLTNLTGLDVDNNQLTSLPESIGNLTNLTRLLLPVNQLTSLPESIGNLTNLSELYLFSNNLTSIPEGIGNLISLEELWLSDNLLSFIPESICDLPEECNILIHNNQLCEEYHYDCIDGWGNQDTSNCGEPSLCDEEIEVELWGECYNIEETTMLILSGLTGEIPPEIGNLTNLTGLVLSSNQFIGGIPPEIGNLTNLTGLFLNNNQLTGRIPSEIGNLTNLTNLDLSDNELTEGIPSEIGNLTNLFQLLLNNNQLMGEIPESICNIDIFWISFPYFDIDNNQLCPPYPDCISEEDIGYQDTSECVECILGDINNDSILNILDIVSMVNLILDGEDNECGDVNSDGVLNILDVVIFVNIILFIP